MMPFSKAKLLLNRQNKQRLHSLYLEILILLLLLPPLLKMDLHCLLVVLYFPQLLLCCLYSFCLGFDSYYIICKTKSTTLIKKIILFKVITLRADPFLTELLIVQLISTPEIASQVIKPLHSSNSRRLRYGAD